MVSRGEGSDLVQIAPFDFSVSGETVLHVTDSFVVAEDKVRVEASAFPGSTVDLAALRTAIIAIKKEGEGNMADINALADQAAEALLKAIRDAAPKSQSTPGVLHLAQAYALIVSAEPGKSPQPPITSE